MDAFLDIEVAGPYWPVLVETRAPRPTPDQKRSAGHAREAHPFSEVVAILLQAERVVVEKQVDAALGRPIGATRFCMEPCHRPAPPLAGFLQAAHLAEQSGAEKGRIDEIVGGPDPHRQCLLIAP